MIQRGVRSFTQMEFSNFQSAKAFDSIKIGSTNILSQIRSAMLIITSFTAVCVRFSSRLRRFFLPASENVLRHFAK